MSVTSTPVFVQIPKVTPQNFVQGTDSAGTFKTIFTAGANGSKIVAGGIATNDGTASHVITLQLKRAGVGYPLGSVTLPINAGTDGSTPAVDLLSAITLPWLPLDNDGQKYLFLESGDTLEATFATALTTSKSIYVNVMGANF